MHVRNVKVSYDFIKASAVWYILVCILVWSVLGSSEHATEAENGKTRDTGTQMVSCYPPPAMFFQGSQTVQHRKKKRRF